MSLLVTRALLALRLVDFRDSRRADSSYSLTGISFRLMASVGAPYLPAGDHSEPVNFFPASPPDTLYMEPRDNVINT